MTDWFEGLEPELLGHLQSRGLDKKEAPDAARQLVRDHREAQQKLGLPADQVLRLPQKADDPAWANVWERLGAGKEAADYKFEGVTAAPELLEDLRAAAKEAGIPVAAATKIAAQLASAAAARGAMTEEQSKAALAADQTTLRQTWGANYDLNLFRAQNAVKALGWDASIVDTLHAAVGGTKVLNGLLQLANGMAEPDTLRGNSPLSSGSLTYQQAVDRKNTLMADRAWGAKWASGDADARTEMSNLDRVIVAQRHQPR